MIYGDEDPPKPVVARFDGRCGLCERKIVADKDEIVNIDEEWVHVECAIETGEMIDFD